MYEINQIISSVLNISADDIESFTSTKIEDETHIYLKLKRKKLICPVCGNPKCLSNGFFKRKIKVPKSIMENFIISLKICRYICPECRNSFSDNLNISPSYKTISYSSIMKIMDLLKKPNLTFKNVSELTGISESSVIRIFDKHCHITRGRFPEVLCIDEIYTKNSAFDSKYSCIFYDFHRQEIIDVTPSRRKNYLHMYFQKLPLNERERVKYVCIDMYLPYKQLIKIYFKKAIICADSFHVVKHLNDDLQKIRIRIMKRYNTDSIEYYLLKHWKNLLFNRQINLDNLGKYNKRLNRVVTYRQLLDMMLDIDKDLKNGYYLKEKYIIFNSSSTIKEAMIKIESLIDDFVNADISEYEEFLTLLINWKQEIINSFTVHEGKRINNSIAESINSQISVLLFNTKGIRNNERRKKRIMYAINKTGFSIK